MKISSIELILIIGTLILSSLACTMGGLTFNGDKATVDITLSEKELNEMIATSTSNRVRDDDEMLKSVSEVEFHDGSVRVYGTMENSSGEEVKGNLDLVFRASEDVLMVEITAVDFPGVSMDDPRVVKANQEMAKALTDSVTRSNGEVKFLEADVTEEGLHIKLQVQTGK
jgi:hypothetical protein